jgi:hypothetical protein
MRAHVPRQVRIREIGKRDVEDKQIEFLVSILSAPPEGC